jgi:hypothetical protein
MSSLALHGQPFDETPPDFSGQDEQWMGHHMEDVVAQQQLEGRSRISLFDLKTPILMLWSFLRGVVLALGRHLYYASRAGTVVHSSNGSNWAVHSQEWVLRFGLAFAFLVNGFFISAVGLAYTQRV